MKEELIKVIKEYVSSDGVCDCEDCTKISNELSEKVLEVQEYFLSDLREEIGRVIRNIDIGRYEVAKQRCVLIDEMLKQYE
jgi:hypothetical protein